MRCTIPRTVGFSHDGKTIVWSEKHISKEYATFQLPCGKCLACRLEYARSWAIRCMHEAQMHGQNNIFVTLTYSDEHLKSPKLNYEDFQLFMKRLRKTQNEPIGFFVTGEYGEQTKRPHWHAILFGYRPRGWVPSIEESEVQIKRNPDVRLKYKTQQGHNVYESGSLTRLWGKGIAEYGEVTLDSANYVARYAAKKIVHGDNKKVKEADDHDYQPISKKSSKHAIGKKFLERYWEDIFNEGRVSLDKGGTTGAIPRYYVKWLEKNHPEAWRRYVTRIRQRHIDKAKEIAQREKEEWVLTNMKRLDQGKTKFTKTQNEIRNIILEDKFRKLQEHLKLK